MPVVTRFRVNNAGMNETLKGRQGPVTLHMANVGRELAGRCRRAAPRGKGDGPHLADHISSKLVPAAGGGNAVQVVFGVSHAIFVIKGTRAHSIGSSVLVGPPSEWRYIGLSPAGKGKIHPGTKPNPFPVRAAAEMGLKLRIV